MNKSFGVIFALASYTDSQFKLQLNINHEQNYAPNWILSSGFPVSGSIELDIGSSQRGLKEEKEINNGQERLNNDFNIHSVDQKVNNLNEWIIR